MIRKFWNKKAKGLFAAIFLMFGVILNKLKTIYLSYYYKSNIGSCGKNVLIMPGFKYRFPCNINIEDGVIIGKNVTLSVGEINSGSIIIKKNASIDNSCFIDYSGNVIINEFAHIAWGSYISTHDHGYDYRHKPTGKPLEIGENAFIGSKSIILHNCNYIGRNAVVGAGSVVTKDVPDYAIVAGNPAHVIKIIYPN